MILWARKFSKRSEEGGEWEREWAWGILVHRTEQPSASYVLILTPKLIRGEQSVSRVTELPAIRVICRAICNFSDQRSHPPNALLNIVLDILHQILIQKHVVGLSSPDFKTYQEVRPSNDSQTPS